MKVIKELISRDAVIGVALDAWMIIPNWKRGISKPYEKKLNINSVINHIDHICQLAGNSNHVGIGSDYDGVEIMPLGLEDVTKPPFLTKKLLDNGFTIREVRKILGENFKRVFKEVL